MDIEHCECLSWFLRRCERHEQDGTMLPLAAMPQPDTASGDPAMAFDLPLSGRAIHSTRLSKSTALSLPDEWRTN
jgi:hypothetical protein